MYQIVNFFFPFADNFDKGKPRPSLVISPAFSKHNHTILAYITSDVKNKLTTDIVIDSDAKYFKGTGLRSTSLVKPYRLITTTPSQIKETIGIFPHELISELKKSLQNIFHITD